MQKFFVVGRTIRRTDLYCYKHGFGFKSVPVNTRGKSKLARSCDGKPCRQFLSL